jgi:hypothetical protein
MRMHHTCLTALCASGLALTASGEASAHYYGQLQNVTSTNGPAGDGAFTQIWTTYLDSQCSLFNRQFVTHEMWYASESGNEWVEVGFFTGQTGGCCGCANNEVFWADSRSGHGYSEHDTGNYVGVPFSSWESLQVSNVGTCEWNVEWFNTSWTNLGNSTSNCLGTGRFLQAGIESTSQGASQVVEGFLTNWWEENSIGEWSTGWKGGGGATLWDANSPNNGPWIEWDGTDETYEWIYQPQ